MSCNVSQRRTPHNLKFPPEPGGSPMSLERLLVLIILGGLAVLVVFAVAGAIQ
jgi:hypothetical protein